LDDLDGGSAAVTSPSSGDDRLLGRRLVLYLEQATAPIAGSGAVERDRMVEEYRAALMHVPDHFEAR
ncbi:MAG: hypothetical protein GWN71_41115, partial [Gammaproteobacteria bacterium]|nr:hypothetical protein [Gemmatimonadota bacterium]NIU79717.1 hypothetical protein [Gammaproteobacteria bacterium]